MDINKTLGLKTAASAVSEEVEEADNEMSKMMKRIGDKMARSARQVPDPNSAALILADTGSVLLMTSGEPVSTPGVENMTSLFGYIGVAMLYAANEVFTDPLGY